MVRALDDEVVEYVSVERGEIDRRIFSDPEIFEQEMQLIFRRAWLFLCHESQVQKAGDFYEAPMGRDNVLVVRQRDGGLKGLLNTCMHRGNAVCRAEEGNTKNFMCTYHGWTYDLAGQLVGVPGFDNLWHGELDKNALGLREVGQLESYKGFVFATMDRSAPPLHDYLGATGRLGIDLLAEQGDMEVIPGVQKFVIDCNWKFAVDNIFDFYHYVTHLSATGGAFPFIGRLGDDPSRPATYNGGATKPDGEELGAIPMAPDSLIVLGEYGHAIGGPSVNGRSGRNNEWRKRPEAQAALGPVGLEVAGHPNIFPSAWITASQLSLRVPRGPMKTEIWWFSFVDKNATAEERERAVSSAIHRFGPAGVLEQEDGENWAQSSMQTTGLESREIPQILQLDLGRGEIIKEHGLARIEGSTNEHAQLWTYAAWAQYMTGAPWETIKANTTPGEFI